MSLSANNDERVLVLAPIGRDALLIAEALHEKGLHVEPCKDFAHFYAQLVDGAAVGALTEEALTESALAQLTTYLAEQPPWSDFPFVVFATRATSAHSSSQRYERLKRLRNFTIFERPIYPVTLVIAIDSALRARRRQYAARGYLEERQRQEAEIREMNRTLEQRVAERTGELQKAQAAFHESQKMEAVGRLAGGIAHDFNNLLTGIYGMSEGILESLPPGDERRRDIEDILTASNRAFSVTRQLLAFSRRQTILPRVIDVNAAILEIQKLLQRLLGEDIEIRLTLGDLAGYTKVDPGQLEQIVINLAINARDAMPKGGCLDIRTGAVTLTAADFRSPGGQAQPGPFIVIEVSDAGAGMSSDVLAHIFEPFFTTKPKDKGTGLGLATVYGIVQQARGDIHVESRVGEGTTFRIYLPRVEESPSSAKPAADDPERTSEAGGRVLVIEDEEIVRKVLVRRLRRAGFEVLEATSGSEAVQIASSAPPVDLVVTDVIMPQMNGREAVEEIRRLHPEVEALYMSGYPADVIATHGVLREGLHFLEKSATGAMTIKVRELIAQKKKR